MNDDSRVLRTLIVVVSVVVGSLLGKLVDTALTAALNQTFSHATGWVVFGTLTICWWGDARRPRHRDREGGLS